MDQTAVTASLSTLLEDTLGQISPDRITSAVNEAWGDGYVATPIFDNTSLVYDVAVYQYDIPATMTTIEAIYLTPAAGCAPQEIDSRLWEVINGQIIFQKDAPSLIPSGFTLQLRGRYKLTPSDSLPANNYALQNYVVNLAAMIIVQRLAFTKIIKFLNNDTSMGELIQFKKMVEQDVLRYRAQLQQSYING